MTPRAQRWLVALVLALTGCSGAQRVGPPKPPENGMWGICYDVVGYPELHESPDEETSCDQPVRLLWPQLPVKAWIDPESINVTTALRAFAAWEDWLGRPVFVLVPEPEDADVAIWADADYLADCGISAAACAPHQQQLDGTIKAAIVFDPEYVRVDVLAHELGHTLGLAHDHNNRRSIMWPDTEGYLLHLSDYDTALLQALYQGR